MNDRIKELKNLLMHYDNLYYNQDTSEITDEEYDSIKKEYLELTGQSEYDYVPGNVSSDLTKVTHSVPIKSLNKVNDEMNLKLEIKRLWPVLVQPKLDGLTVVAYKDKFVSRGNGLEGEDITATASRIPNIHFGTEAEPVRMEVFMPVSEFNKLNEERIANNEKPFENCRNAAAGMLRNKDASKVKGLTYYAYNIPGSSKSETEQLKTIYKMGFNVVPTGKFKDVEETANWILHYDRDKLNYDIDGIVVKSDIPDSLKVFGETHHHPKGAIAYKFPSQGGWTKLTNVMWQVGRSGKLTPVGVFDEIRILGSTITNATLNNIDYIDALGLQIGMEVHVVKANDVIPRIIGCWQTTDPVTPITVPAKCPECGSDLKKVNSQHFCTGEECPAKTTNMVLHMARREALNIDELGEETVNNMFGMELINEPTDIFKLTEEDIKKIPGYAVKSSKSLYKNIQEARKDVPLDHFLYAAGIPGIGRRASKDIADKYLSFDNFISNLKSSNGKCLTSIEGIGDKTVYSLIRHWRNVGKLFKYITPVDMVKLNTGNIITTESFNFVITGTLSKGRSYVEKIIASAGCKVSSSVTKKTDYLVVGDKPGGTKFTKAQQLQTPMITEDELFNILNGVTAKQKRA